MLIVYAHCVATFLLLVFVDFFALLPLSFFSFPGSSGFSCFLSAFILDCGLALFGFFMVYYGAWLCGTSLLVQDQSLVYVS